MKKATQKMSEGELKRKLAGKWHVKGHAESYIELSPNGKAILTGKTAPGFFKVIRLNPGAWKFVLYAQGIFSFEIVMINETELVLRGDGMTIGLQKG